MEYNLISLLKVRFVLGCLNSFHSIYLTRVHPDVCSEIVPASEGSATPLALVALLSRVPPDVVHQRARVRETPAADVALVWLFS